jgi:hypothetical protein
MRGRQQLFGIRAATIVFEAAGKPEGYAFNASV